ncbi:hypothetical protein HMPREF1982_03197 [Clostridiales bacterium oral taxon 876 str. F0540]|nr:hypothetical protein HMPREF1982_03197 [Clostridiales bacterium oral taxon 876 str. F0540]
MRCSEYRVKNADSSVLFYFSPGNLTSTSNRFVPILAFLKEGREYIDFPTAKLFLDDEEIPSKIDNFTISSSHNKPIGYGCHYIKVVVKLLDGDIQDFIWSFIIEDELLDYNFYYGIPHSHTSYSDGFGTPTEAYEKAKNNGLDFLIVTDHQGKLARGKFNYDKSISLFGGNTPKWEMLKLEAEAMNFRNPDFAALYGFELSTNFWGHINIINSNTIIAKKPSSIEDLYTWLCTEDNILLSVNHPHRSPKTLPFTHNLDNFVNLYEVGNGSTTRIYTRTEENYYAALDYGWHIAAINGQDNHSDDWGDSNNVTAVICKELSSASLINAIKLRRVYSTESRSLKLAVKGNGKWMGSVLNLKKGDILGIHILAEDNSSPIEKLQIITNRGEVAHEKSFGGVCKCEWNLTTTIDDEYKWYVVKVIHTDGKVGISSALFVQDINL